ncbi:MAG: SpoIIE family protein phosphatase [Flavobacteriales bacterium]|nr:SpoIIE family protein phosphatase [Flavobacteriales bacterium]
MKTISTYTRSFWKFSIAILILMAYGIAHGQGNFSVRRFDESHGLASNFAEAITQGSTGHLVIANKGGIDIFDGKEFRNIKVENDTNSIGYITSIYRSEDEIWFGKFDGNIGVIRNGIEIIRTGISGQVKHVYKDSQSGIWAFSRSGMVLWVQGSDTNRYDMAERDMLINAVIPYKHKEFIIGSNDGLWLIRFESGNDFQVLRKVEGLPDTKITALKYETGKDVLWVGTEDAGIYTVASPFTKEQHIEEFKLLTGESIDEVQTIYSDHLNRIWLGTFGKGLIRIEYYGDDKNEYTTQTFHGEVDENNLIRDIYEDNENNIWIATFGGGLLQIIENVFHRPFDSEWLKKQSITQLFRDSRSNIWLGIDKGIFKTSEHASRSKYQYYHVGGNLVSTIAEDNDGKIWIGTAESGVYLLANGAQEFSRISGPNEALASSINNILCTHSNVYISTKAGLLIYSLNGKLKRRLTTIDGLPHNNVNCCFEDSDGRVWIACQGNRICYLWNEEIRFIQSTSAQNVIDVNHILEDDSSRLWFATLGQGISVLDENVVYNLNEENGLPSNYCYQMVLDEDQNVWVSHQKSITQISPELKMNRIISREELTETENSMISFLFKDEEGSIWISSTHNVVKFNPAIDRSSKAKPQLSISSMWVFDQEQPLIQDLKLPYKKYDISFKLAGISLRNPDALTYKYQLKGLSDSWKTLEGTDKIETSLSYGTYTLSVYASKNGGPWTDEPVTYTFTILRPFWLSWWFWTIFSLAVTIGVIVFVRYRTYKLIKDNEELEALVQERTIEIQEQKAEIENSRDEIAKYAKDITDSIKYAKRIQKAIFPAWKEVVDILPEAVVFFQSKDLVSGDFYIAEQVGDKRIFAAIDCTGHGVPGGFMSIMGNNLLQQAIRQAGLTRPSEILEYVNQGLTETLHQTYEESSVKDGMDIALCTWDSKTNVLEFAGAYNPMYLFQNGELIEFKGDRFPVGAFIDEEIRQFTNHQIKVNSGDMVYVFSDGFSDQFGGPNGKKFMLRRFKDMLKTIHKKPVDEQYDLLAKYLKNWKGNLEQVDDICVVGVRIP